MPSQVTNSVQIKLGVQGLAAATAAFASLNKSVVSFSTSVAAAAAPFTALAAALSKAAALASGALFAGAVAGLRDIVNLTSELNDESNRTGIGVAQLLLYRQAFQDVGLGADQVADSIGKLQAEIGKAATEGDAAQSKFERLGLNFEELQALDPSAQFDAVSKAIGKIEDPTLRAAAAVSIFGRSGKAMLALFKDGSALDQARESLGRLPEILGRNVVIFDEIADRAGHLPNKLRQFFAGVADILGPQLLEAVQMLDRIDLSGAGQRVAAFIKFVVNEFKAGNITETIKLVFQLGFLEAENAFNEFTIYVGGKLADQKLVDAFTANLIDAFKFATDALVTGLSYGFTVIGAFMLQNIDKWRFAIEVLANLLKQGFAAAANLLITGIEKAGNAAIKIINALSGSDFSKLKLRPITVDDAPIKAVLTFEQALLEADKLRASGLERIKGIIDGIFATIKETLGLEVDTTTDAEKRAKLLDQIAKLQKQIADIIAASNARPQFKPDTGTPDTSKPFRLDQEQIALKKQLFDLETEQQLLEANYAVSAADKQAAKLRALDQERKLLQENLDVLQRQADLAKTPEDAEKIKSEIERQREALARNRVSVAQQGPAAGSISQNLTATAQQMADQIGTVAQQIARSFRDVVGGAINSVSEGISGLIKGTVTWGQALKNIGGSIMNSLIDAVSRMFTEWIAGLLLKSLVTQQTAAADAAAQEPAAMLTSISSFGVAAIVGLAAFAAAMALVGGFAKGGFTGAGSPSQPAGMVHREEYVLPADEVRQIGIPAIEAFRADGAGPGGSSVAGAAIENNVNVYAYNSQQDAFKAWMESPEGRAVFVDLSRKTSHIVSR